MGKAIPSFPHSRINRDERCVYTIEIHDAKRLNILSSAVILGMTAATNWISAQTDARAVIIRGSGEDAFVGGADIFEMAALQTPAAGRAFIGRLRDLCDAVIAVPVPTIARISGFCLGGGLELAAACDIRLGAQNAVFGMPEVRIGIPSVVHALLLPRLIGQGATNWMLLTGDTITADQALRWGFLQFASAATELDALVEQTIASILASGPHAVRSQKALLRFWQSATTEAGIDRSVEAFGEAFTTDEPHNCMAPFLKRKHSQTDS